MTDAQRLRAEVVDVERRFWVEGGGNPAFWRHHCHDDAVILLPFGIIDKAQTVAAMEEAGGWTSAEMADLRVVPLAEGTVAVAYRALARGPEGSDYSAVVGSVYVRHDGAWQLAFHQQTPVAGT